MSEIRYRRLFESARDGILILDAETGKIIDVNPFMIEFLGYTREEFLGRELWKIGVLNKEDASRPTHQVYSGCRFNVVNRRTGYNQQL